MTRIRKAKKFTEFQTVKFAVVFANLEHFQIDQLETFLSLFEGRMLEPEIAFISLQAIDRAGRGALTLEQLAVRLGYGWPGGDTEPAPEPRNDYMTNIKGWF